jgi:hypothetical protein
MKPQMTPRLLALVAALGGSACVDFLSAENFNNPDIDRVFAEPAAIEQALGTSYQLCRNLAITTDIQQQMSVMGLERYSQLGNFLMGVRGAIPRSPILNNRSATQAQPETFSGWSRQARFTANAIQALDRHLEDGRTLGTPAQSLRARAMGFFGIGCNLGWLAMVYDSAGLVNHRMDAEEVPPLSGYNVVMDAALANLDSAIHIAVQPAASGAGGFPVPAPWFSGNALSAEQFTRLVRSYKARFRAGVARTPEERAAADWNAIIADAEKGLTSDLIVRVGTGTGWNFKNAFFALDVGNQMPLFIWGFADVSGAYSAWIARPFSERREFLVVTPDLRWPNGTTRQEQTSASRQTGAYHVLPYVTHGPDLVTGEAWGISQYVFTRYGYINRAGGVGNTPDFLKTEVDLLAAEGYLRTNRLAEAAAKIDLSRVTRGGLPALSGTITSPTQVVPGGAQCVPRVPQPPAFTSTACGTILEALKYEKRFELAFLALGAWFFDARGWGDLVQDTPLEYPVPVVELDARNLPHYNLGGGGTSSARRGTYGFP